MMAPAPPTNRSGKYVLVIRIGQTEGTIMGSPIFDQSVVESGCHLANEVTGPRSCGSGWFSSIDQLLRLGVSSSARIWVDHSGR